ncbi:MAG: hydroxymethylbilane synthase [Patiriisocius sp.]|jgi:hydroxymethylbilane synthase
MNKVIRIGTRDSQLALWQAHAVQDQLESLGYKTQLIPVKAVGDLKLDTPLYELGITGIFTKTLDLAMLNNSVDIAVHSMKDVPTALPKGIVQAAVLKRANTLDILATKEAIDYKKHCTIATGSLRRKAQWLDRYPHHTLVDLRGNVNTRLQKLKDNPWDGAIFAKAGLERINVLPEQHTSLDWMTPAPAQGAMVIVALEKDPFCIEAAQKLNDTPSQICTQIERDFLRTLEGGCTAPIGALAKIEGDEIQFKGCLFSLDGSKKIEIERTVSIYSIAQAGEGIARELLDAGGAILMKEIKINMTS